MNIKVVCIGKLKEKYWTLAIEEYSKRLKSYCKLDIVELKESPRDNINAEGEAILAKIDKSEYVITLEIKGKSLTSEKLAKKIEDLAIEGKSDVTFVIGGSEGLSQEVMDRSNFALSFSAMTFPHQMIRVFLLEQIYRIFKIIKHEPYHK